MPAREDTELPPWSRDPVFSHMDFVRPHVSVSGSKTTNAAAQVPLPTLLTSASSRREAVEFMLDGLLRKLSRSLMMAMADIEPERSTGSYGVDSLVAVEVRNWFLREAKVDMPVFEILQANTLTGFSGESSRKKQASLRRL